MPILKFVLPDGTELVLPTIVSPAADHKSYYAHGAQGGIMANYHFRIDFYQEIAPPMIFKEVGGKMEYESMKQAGVERKIVATVYLPLPFSKELVTWMDKNIKQHESQYGPIQLPQAVDITELTKQPTQTLFRK